MPQTPKLKKTLYIGLGGTGFKTLVHTKKAFIETYGEVPPMIRFLAFDSDVNQESYSLPSIYGNVSLAPSERQSLSVTQARAKVEHSRNLITWLPDRNIRAVADLVNGCGMVRTNGRIAFAFNYQKSKNAIQNALSEISKLANVHNDKYDLLGADVEVNLVFSIAGGTGSGTFIDMAYLIKNIFEANGLPETSKIIGYMVLPDVYDAQLTFGKERLMPNALGSLIDLDYFSHQEFTDSVRVNYLTDQITLKGSPFNTIFTIGNTNHNGDIVDNSDTLSQMMSLAMVVSAGELSSGVASVANNLERDMNSGDYDIENKRAILSTLGMSEITFRSSGLKHLYNVKAAREFAAALLNPGMNADIDANSWIDEMQIRENNGRDDVIDYLLSKMPTVIFQEINDDANPRSDVDSYRQQSTVAVNNNAISQKISELETYIENSLSKKLKEIINAKGSAYAQDFLSQVKNQIKICMGEMQDERRQFIDAANARESAISVAIEEYKSACKKLFGKAKAKSEALEVLSDAVTKAVINDREIHRRNGAITLYTWLLNKIDSYDTKLTAIIGNVRTACQLISRQIAESTAQLNSSRGIFEIDLTGPYIDQVQVNPQDIVLNQYVNSLPDGEKISDFGQLDPKQIAAGMVAFASTIQPEANWDKMSVEDALAKLPKKTAEEILRKAIKLASPMCTLNFRGHLNKDLLNYYYVGVHEQSTTILNGNILQIRDCIDGSSKFEVTFASIGSRDRIVIFHQYGVFPTYAIGRSQAYRHAYDSYTSNINSYSCHLDEDMRIKMDRNGFSVIPKERIDNSLEMWVKGLIFGLITRDNEGIYHYKDEDNEETALDGYITSLNTTYRDEAFREFKVQAERLMPQYERIMGERTKRDGQAAIDAIISDAKENYLKKYSLNRYTTDELKNSLYQNIRKQINDELNFIKNEL